jgi:heme/copper-type cytochrome/quinol oxidase subunit 2
VRFAGAWILAVAGIAAAAGAGAAWAADPGQDETTTRAFTLIGRRYEFVPARIDVDHGDLVAITLKSEDIAHSFTIDEYRISKRFSPGHPVTVEFRADLRGSFTFYCDLAADEGCRKMRGTLVVH